MTGSADNINCHEARRMLWEYLDEELTPERTELVRAHLRICAHCFSIANLERLFLEGIAATRETVTVPDDLRERIVIALEQAGLRRE